MCGSERRFVWQLPSMDRTLKTTVPNCPQFGSDIPRNFGLSVRTRNIIWAVIHGSYHASSCALSAVR